MTLLSLPHRIVTPQSLPSKLQTPQVAAGPWDLGPLELRWFCIFPGEPHILLPGCISPKLAYPRLADSTQQGGTQLGTGILLGPDSEPTELTKPLLPHPPQAPASTSPCPLSLPVLHWGQQGVLPVSSSPLRPTPPAEVLPTVTLDNQGR